jgi:hypothetical protein
METLGVPTPGMSPGAPASRPIAVPAKKSFIAKLAGAVSNHAYLSLAVIVVLLIIVIGLVVYYRGLLFLGPYAPGARRGKGPHKKKKDEGGAEGGASGSGPDAQGDPETEKLIDSINRH